LSGICGRAGHPAPQSTVSLGPFSEPSVGCCVATYHRQHIGKMAWLRRHYSLSPAQRRNNEHPSTSRRTLKRYARSTGPTAEHAQKEPASTQIFQNVCASHDPDGHRAPASGCRRPTADPARDHSSCAPRCLGRQLAAKRCQAWPVGRSMAAGVQPRSSSTLTSTASRKQLWTAPKRFYATKTRSGREGLTRIPVPPAARSTSPFSSGSRCTGLRGSGLFFPWRACWLLPFAALVDGEQAVEQSNSVNFAMALRT
jgi:hypothetical protein